VSFGNRGARGVMGPIKKIRELASEGLDAVGAALSDVPRRLNHQTHRVAITGLRRSGKTVFVTSFAHALLNAPKAPNIAFPFFPWRGRILEIGLHHIPGIARFPYEERLADLLEPTSKWPDQTTGVTGLRIRIRYSQEGLLARRLSSSTTIDLDLIDYPGELLLDLPMLKQSFGRWSAQMTEIASTGSRANHSASWQKLAAALDPHAQTDTTELNRIGALYRDYLIFCRDKLNLHYLQPGRFLLGEEEVLDPGMLFFPLVNPKAAKPGTNAGELAKRYSAYQRLIQNFYNGVFGRLRKQVILVDLLTALHHGHESFADLALAIRTITDAFEQLRSPLLKLLPRAPVDRLALVATKADHVTADQLNNLVGLLRDMIGDPIFLIDARQSGLLAVASVRATTEVSLMHAGVPLQFLQGIPEGKNDVVVVRPGVIPGQIPADGSRKSLDLNIRKFMPPRLPSPFEEPLPHINLDKVLQFLIA
jgi:predicted YcjX-like family ATPase